ncbi:signal recognition particle-docking protein FtsY [Candidatus Woesearchaeota archaeon]|nr:signal recognition particle-docking protein FtsY [Candidatus Woesearchaeota archaeon]
MFNKLKNKLKEALSVFSKKTEEEAEKKEEVVEEPIKEEPAEAEPKEEKATEEETPVEETPKEEPVEEKPKEETLEEPQPEIKEEEVEEKAPEPEPETPTPKEEVKETKEEPPKEEKAGFFKKIKQTITTKTISEEKFDKLFWDLELLLLENNVSVEVIEKIKQDLKLELVDKPLPRDVLKKIQETLTKTLTEILSLDPIDLINKIKQKDNKPFIIAIFGINGSGKTTTVAKLSHLFQQNGLKTVLAASDTFRAAAIQQLEEHAQKLNTRIIKHDYGSDAAAVAFDAIKYAQKNKLDVVLIDTAGRLHSNTNLMDELKKLVRVTNPDLKVFIGESITGNDCIEQAKKFQEIINIDAAILTKADIDEKGGAPLSISYTIKKPILYLGVGQEYSQLEEFNAQTILKRLGF